MFDPSYPGRRRVAFSGASQVEDKTSLLNRARQERQQRQQAQHQESTAVRIQRWYRSHRQRKVVRSTLRQSFDADWKRFTASLASSAPPPAAAAASPSPAADRQLLLMRLVRQLWLFYDAQQDGLRLVSLLAGVVKSHEQPTNSSLSYLHTRTPDPSPLWPLQAAHLCVLCLSKLLTETKRPPSSAPTVGDVRLCSLVTAALTSMLDHAKWRTQSLDAAAVHSSALQHQRLLDSLAVSRAFFPLLGLLLTRLRPDDPGAPSSPFAVALFTAVVNAVVASSRQGPTDAFTTRFVTDLLTLPCTSSLLLHPPLQPLFTVSQSAFTSRLLTCADRVVQPPSRLSSPFTASLSSIPPPASLLGNLAQLSATVNVRHADVPTLLHLLHTTSALLQSLPRTLLHEHEEKAPAFPFTATQHPPDIRLPAHSIPLSAPLTDVLHARQCSAVLKQFTPLSTSSFFISLLHRAFLLDSPSPDIDLLLSSYSLTSTAAHSSERLLVCFGSFIHAHPSYIPLVCRLLTLSVDRSPFARSALSSLTFNTPILLLLWRTLEVTVGCKLSGLHTPSHATAEQLKAASSTPSSLLSLFLHPSKPSKALPHQASPTDPLRAARRRWEAAITRADADGGVQSMFVLFLHCFLPLLFILEDDELISHHPPFESLLTLQQLALLIKFIVFRLLWEGEGGEGAGGGGGLGDHLAVCRMILVELHQRDIRCSWMSEGRVSGEPAGGRDEDEEERVVQGGRAWLIDAEDGGSEWTSAWLSWLEHSDSASLDDDTDERKLPHHPPSLLPLVHMRVQRVLRALPFITSFRDRVLLFRRQLAHHRAGQARAMREIRVRRSQVVADGLAAVDHPGNIRVKFVDETGEDEQGMDIGGPFKELLELLTKEVFRLDYALFTSTASHTFYPNPAAPELVHGAQDLLRSVGRLIGRCIGEGILLEVALASVVLQKMVGQGRVLSDLKELDDALYSALMQVKRYDGNVEDLCLTFSVDEEVAGVKKTVELEDGGASKAVINSNRTRFIYQAAEYHLHVKLRPVMAPFIAGMASVIPMSALRWFNLSEVRLLLSGSHQPLDVQDWAAHTHYDLCDASSRHVRWFWQCVADMSEGQQKQLLQFVTSVSRSPYLGFGAMNPPFTVRLVGLGEGGNEEGGALSTALMGWLGKKGASGALPSASTCFNLLKLPKYASQAIMKDKLLTAITAKGFHLV